MDETEIPLTPDTPILTVHVDNSSNESVDDSLIDKSPDTASNGEFVSILLIGKAGSGKSTAGNIISGNVAFDVSPIAQLVTTECQEENIRINDVQVKLVDTPGFFNLKFENSIVQEKLGEYLKTHRHMFPLIFVLCIQNGVRFTKEDEDVIKYIEENFGSRVFQNLIVVFTGTGSMIYNNKDTHKEDMPKWFEKLQQRVEQRTFYFQNDTSENDNKVALFLATCQKLLKTQ
ncbi:unnamed protein product [Mytilus edulis]|uniref:AIG1-type G domain-containing protein n=1 Tax=Mytilus edulis TaxID=6550 RepID=A0A8S3UPD7_MYTED|nr:unnamed protein product [Mytilus edulis]